MASTFIARIDVALGKLSNIYDPNQLERDILRLTQQIEANPSNWKVAQELARVSQQYQAFREISEHCVFLKEYVDETGEDETLVTEGTTLLSRISDLLLQQKFSGPYDHESALITLQRGEGGKTLDDFIRSLVGAYDSFACHKNLRPEFLASNGETVLEIVGENGFGFFGGEHGVHKCIYMNEQNRVHTGYVTVTVEPLIEQPEITIGEKDLRYEFLSGSTPGGQHANKAQTGVRITHVPTGLQAVAKSRSQSSNLKDAKQVLFSRVTRHYADQTKNPGDERVPPQRGGHHFRTYRLTGSRFIKDHRSNVTTFDVDSFFRGDIEPFILGDYHIAID